LFPNAKREANFFPIFLQDDLIADFPGEMNSAQSKSAGLPLLALIVILDQRQESDDQYPLGRTDCRINGSRSSAARLPSASFAAILLGGLIGLQRV